MSEPHLSIMNRSLLCIRSVCKIANYLFERTSKQKGSSYGFLDCIWTVLWSKEGSMKTYQGGTVIGHKKKFAIVKVGQEILDNKEMAIATIQSLLPFFEGLPVVLVAEENEGTPNYFARPDLMKFLMDFHLPSVEWKEYEVPDSTP